MKSSIILSTFCLLLLAACNQNQSSSDVHANPAAPGFDLDGSDEKAIQLADQVMEAMGGRSAWDETRFIRWNFFGRRTLTWDKHEQLCRIEIPGDSLVFLIDLNETSGRVKKGNFEFTERDTLTTLVERGRSIWINDSYWLVMPYKLKDSGVTLRYIGQDTTGTGANAEVLELTFENVGVTPDNRYLVYVDDATKLVSQWDFYTNYADSTARFSTPWADYNQHGSIMLSGNRGRGMLTDIEVIENLEPAVFTEF